MNQQNVLDAFRLDNKIALVTGASAGLGAAMAQALAEAGAHVIVHGNARSPETTCGAIRARGGHAQGVVADLTHAEGVTQLYHEAMQYAQRIDILCNNAGMLTRAPAAEYPLSEWQTVLQVNLNAAFQLSQLVGQQMIARFQHPDRARLGWGGKIINTASLLSFQGGVNVPAYAASKGALAQLTKALANEWAQYDINVNAIAPGYMRTEITAALQNDETRARQILERIPAKRWGEPQDLAGAAVFLASSASNYLHGHILVVDGGWLAR